MPEILLPWDSQPQEAVGVDYRHPASESLALLWSGACPLTDADGVGVLASASVSPTVGSGVKSAAFGAGGYIRFSDRIAKANDFTIGAQFYVGDVTTGQFILSRALEASPFPFNWVLDVSGGNLRFFSDADSYAALSTPVFVGRLYTVVGTVDALRVWRLFVNGAQVATRTGTANPTTTGAQEVRISTNNGGLYRIQPGGGVTWAYGATRALSPDIAASLSANPWQLFAPRRLYIPSGTIISLPTLSLPTYAPGSITSSGFRPRVTAS